MSWNLFQKSQKKFLKQGRSYIDSLHWIKNKKTTINLFSKKDINCFKYALTVALNHEDIKKKRAKSDKN